MDKPEFVDRLKALLNQTLDDGPGPRAVANLTAIALADFLLNEAGANAPAAIEEGIERLQAGVGPTPGAA